jgi:hypothetical protein
MMSVNPYTSFYTLTGIRQRCIHAMVGEHDEAVRLLEYLTRTELVRGTQAPAPYRKQVSATDGWPIGWT